MARINDYLDWRGDLEFRHSPFNEVDNYILSKIGTIDYSDIVPASDSVPIKEAIASVISKSRTAVPTLTSKAIVPCILRLPDLERYSSLRLWGFESKLIPEETEQFSGLTIILPDDTLYVSFRGTDDTIVAWKEDFLLGVQDSVEAQSDAASYLTRAALLFDGPIIVGGHSKGGNLAVFAAANAPEEIQRRIIAVYNNDGPGFSADFLSSEGYLRIRDKLTTIISQHSIVGTLLEQDRIKVVKTDAFGIAAHDGFTWNVMGTAFVRAPALSRASQAFDNAIKDTLSGMDTEDRREFVDDFFSVLYSTGANTISDFSRNRLQKTLEIAKSLKSEKSVRKFVSQTLEQMIRELKE